MSRTITRALVALIAALGLSSAASATALADSGSGSDDREVIEVSVLTINDFHGRIEAAPSSGAAGAAALAGAVAQKRAENANTVFVSAGDNIGASTFTSFISEDRPTIESLLAAGLELSVVGNHEFDRDSSDLRGRVLDLYGAPWYGLGANVYLKGTHTPALEEYRIVEVGGVRIGFIGTVTEQTGTSVTPQLVADLDFGSQLLAAERVAAEIDPQVDATVLLTHDGSFSHDCGTIAQEQSIFGDLVRQASPLIDAIVSGHTHVAYNCEIAGRPVMQAGHFGAALGEVRFDFDAQSGALTGVRSSILPLLQEGRPLYPADAAVQAIVDEAVAQADILGAREVGRISADILRGGMPLAEDRAVESPLGNLVADIMLDALRVDGVPVADIALMNPGGVRADLLYGADGVVTYRDVASVLPFANSIFTIELSGEQLKQLLEQQWYLSGETELKRHLGVSEGFSYSYSPERAMGDRVLAMWLHGQPIDPAGVYTIASHTFLVGGGDGFTVFTQGSDLIDTGRNDLQIAIEFFGARQLVEPPAIGRAVLAQDPTDEGSDDSGGSDGSGPGEPVREQIAATGSSPGTLQAAALVGLVLLLAAALLRPRAGGATRRG